MSLKEKSEEASETPDGARDENFASRLFGVRWSVVAGLCVVVAAVCLLMGRMDAAFVVATLGVVAWFWNERNRLRPRGIERDEKSPVEEEDVENRVEE
ncbi:MAG TPA: hypothetical protein VGW12_03525 [Pyrinomonadaceae bacterium]|nr:hypothetical protein [Pyrinomonadaceae bacterium]